MKRNQILASIILLVPVALGAITPRQEIAQNPAKAGGVYFAYPTEEISPEYGTKAPKGYEPFYLSHYGRHGSRYLISDKDYKRVIDRLADAEEAGALTQEGLKLKKQLDTIWIEARGRGGELTPLGNRQHKGIAQRVAKAYPEIFACDAIVNAASTPVMRCAHSMFSFIEGLKEFNPTLEIPRESAERNMFYLNYHSKESGPYSSERGPWFQDYKRFKEKKTNPDRLIKNLFSNQDYVDRWFDPKEFMWDLYWVAVDLQNMETDINLLPLFTNEELFNLWEVFNFNFYACNSSYPRANGLHIANAKNLVDHIITNADKYIAEGKHGATLRFGHDGNIIPLTALLGLEGCYSDVENPDRLAESYADFRISPMASNLQMVFFRKIGSSDNNDVLVRIYLNEQDRSLPLEKIHEYYYRWEDLRPYLKNIVHSPAK